MLLKYIVHFLLYFLLDWVSLGTLSSRLLGFVDAVGYLVKSVRSWTWVDLSFLLHLYMLPYFKKPLSAAWSQISWVVVMERNEEPKNSSSSFLLKSSQHHNHKVSILKFYSCSLAEPKNSRFAREVHLRSWK